jgi:hypothetical protein
VTGDAAGSSGRAGNAAAPSKPPKNRAQAADDRVSRDRNGKSRHGRRPEGQAEAQREAGARGAKILASNKQNGKVQPHVQEQAVENGDHAPASVILHVLTRKDPP